MTLLVTVAALLAPHPATHHHDRADCPRPLERAYTRHYHQVARRHGKRAPGRNIRRFGVVYRHHVFDAVCSELRRSDRQLRRLLTAPTYPTLERRAVQPAQPPAGVRTTGTAPGGTLTAIAQCESGGNYSTNTGNGFYGAYQFTQSTWNSVGGQGNPAAASPAEQDQRAARLYAQQGASPWPVCGR